MDEQNNNAQNEQQPKADLEGAKKEITKKPLPKNTVIICAIAAAAIVIGAVIAIIIALGGSHEHTPVTDKAVAPTCTESGLTEGSHCSECGEVIEKQKKISALPHSLDEWILTNDAVYCDEKEYTSTCSVCGSEETKRGADSDHSWSTVTTAPTCQSAGYDTKTCSICSKTETCNEVSASEHEYSDSYFCDADGHWQECSVCHTEGEKRAHSFDDSGECTDCHELSAPTEGVLYWLSEDGTFAYTMGYEGNATRVRIASEYEGVPVTTIARMGSDLITEIILPDSITTIYDRAFSGSKNLVKINIPSSVTEIMDSAFSSCTSLQSIKLSDNLKTIGRNAFSHCEVLTEITIPNSVTSIGMHAFDGCTALSEITLPNGITELGEYFFYNCSSLSSIEIPESVTSIGPWAFLDCSSLKSVTISKNVTSIGDYAFSMCYALEEMTVDPDNCFFASIDGNLYTKNCDKLLRYMPAKTDTSFSIPESVRVVGESAFQGCQNLTEITIPRSVEAIERCAFLNCTALESVELPSTVTTLGDTAFDSCTAFKSVVLGGIKAIDGFTFNCCSSLESITIPGSVEAIGGYAFQNCSSLKTVIMGAGVTNIYGFAFEQCKSLEGVYIEDLTKWCEITFGDEKANPLYYAKKLYYNDENFTEITSVIYAENIKAYAFYNCESIKEVTIGGDVSSIGKKAFMGCSNLNRVTFTDADGWKCNKTDIPASDLSTPSTAAQYLSDTYSKYSWSKS